MANRKDFIEHLVDKQIPQFSNSQQASRPTNFKPSINQNVSPKPGKSSNFKETDDLHDDLINKLNSRAQFKNPLDELKKANIEEDDRLVQLHNEGHDEEDDEEEDDDSLDGLNIDKDEDIQLLLTELNDTAIQALKNEDNENSLECLKRGEQLLEAVTAEGKEVDRNLIIVILYNLACTYQRMSMLEDCASYLDGTIYNLEAKVTNFDDNESILQLMIQTMQHQQSSSSSNNSMELSPKTQKKSPQLNAIETSRKFNISAKLFKLRYMCKCHLQLCAVLSQLNKHQEALYHGQMASFFCQELIKNTHILCKSYIARLLQEKNKSELCKELENDLLLSQSNNSQDEEIFNNRRISYYVEENEKILNLLITNCEPILGELVKQVNHFNTYNKIQKVIDKAGIEFDEISIAQDCKSETNNYNKQNLYQNAQTNLNVPNTSNGVIGQSNYNKLKNTYLTAQPKPTKNAIKQPGKPIDEVMPPSNPYERKAIKLNESTYYNTKGQDGEPQSYFTQLKNNVKTILGVKEQDDWISNLNIGNVMHLLPMSLEELNLHTDNSHELSRDAMLEKIVLLSVSYFCVGTELRFLSSTNKEQTLKYKNPFIGQSDHDGQDVYTKADSEMWHAQALEASGTFLPSECPLVSHVIVSYQKHHSPALAAIPEDEPLIEELKVVRPLNEVRQGDQVNYHQIIRAYNTQRQLIPQPRVSSRNSSRPQTGKQGAKTIYQAGVNHNIFYMTHDPSQHQPQLQQVQSNSKLKMKKRGDNSQLEQSNNGGLDLIEPDDHAQMIHANMSQMSLNNKSSQQYANHQLESPNSAGNIMSRSPNVGPPPHQQIKLVGQNQNHHIIVMASKPPVSQSQYKQLNSMQSRNTQNLQLQGTSTDPNIAKSRPSTAKNTGAKIMIASTYKMDLNNRLMQTMNIGGTIKSASNKDRQSFGGFSSNLQAAAKKSCSRLSSAGSSQQRKSSQNGSKVKQATNGGGVQPANMKVSALASPKGPAGMNLQSHLAISTGTKQPKKLLLTQRLLAETQNLGGGGATSYSHIKKKSTSGSNANSMAQPPRSATSMGLQSPSQQHLINIQNFIQPQSTTSTKKQPQVMMINKAGLATKAKVKVIKLK